VSFFFGLAWWEGYLSVNSNSFERSEAEKYVAESHELLNELSKEAAKDPK
jgi:hypothetical protein